MIVLDQKTSGLRVGETGQFTCPACGKDRFYVTRKDAATLAYICHRASCGVRGYQENFTRFDESSEWSLYLEPPTPPKQVPYTPWMEMTEEDLQYLEDRFLLVEEDYLREYVYKGLDGGWIMPIYSPDSSQVRAVAYRSTYEKGVDAPKRVDRVIRYDCPKDRPIAGLYPAITDAYPTELVVVESVMDALRVAHQGYDAYALLGTNFGDQHCWDILSRSKYNEVTFALDPDAVLKALGHCVKWGSAFPLVNAVRMEMDPKDFPCDRDLMEALRMGRPHG